jgi:hypothetical protein
MLRQSEIEQVLKQRMAELICPAPEVIDWVVETIMDRSQESAAFQQKKLDAVRMQVELISRMDEVLYDDKLSGEISADKYQEKHRQFQKQIADLHQDAETIKQSQQASLDTRPAILELSQRAVQLYEQRAPDQKRLIISLLFDQLTLKNGALLVSYTSFAQVIAQKVLESTKLMEAVK